MEGADASVPERITTPETPGSLEFLRNYTIADIVLLVSQSCLGVLLGRCNVQHDVSVP